MESVAVARLVVGGTLLALALGNLGLKEKKSTGLGVPTLGSTPGSPVKGARMLPSQGLDAPFCKVFPKFPGEP